MELDNLIHEIKKLNNDKIGITSISIMLNIDRKKLKRICKENNIELHRRTYKDVCKQCGKCYESIRANNLYCSENCRKKSYKRKKRIQKYIGECCTLIGRSVPIYYLKCKGCNSTKINRFYKRNYWCSEECKDNRSKNNVIPKIYKKRCVECKEIFETKKKNQKFCKIMCQKKYHYRKKDVKRRMNILKNGTVDWDISINEIIKRDGCKCYLCNEDVKLDVHYNNDKAPTIEHVVPIALGGTHTWNNVKVAHRKCNNYKGINMIYPRYPKLSRSPLENGDEGILCEKAKIFA